MDDISLEPDDSSNDEEEVSNEPDTPEIVEASSESGIVNPAASAQEVRDMYQQFQDLKSEVLDPSSDQQSIGGNVFVTKSGWRKIATAFNVSVEVVDKDTWTDRVADGYEIYHAQIKARAEAPNGKSTTAVGVCSSNESNFLRTLNVDGNASIEAAGKEASKYVASSTVPPEIVVHIDNRWRMIKPLAEVNVHDIIATASTRAKNRAISDLVGGGEVSAEEVSKEDII